MKCLFVISLIKRVTTVIFLLFLRKNKYGSGERPTKCTKEVLVLVLTEGSGGWNWAKNSMCVGVLYTVFMNRMCVCVYGR